MWHAAVLHHYHLLRHEHPTNADTTAVRPPFDSRWHANANRPKSASSYSRKNGKPRCRLTDVTRLKIKFLSSYVCSSEARQTWLHEYIFKTVFCDCFRVIFHSNFHNLLNTFGHLYIFISGLEFMRFIRHCNELKKKWSVTRLQFFRWQPLKKMVSYWFMAWAMSMCQDLYCMWKLILCSM